MITRRYTERQNGHFGHAVDFHGYAQINAGDRELVSSLCTAMKELAVMRETCIREFRFPNAL